MTLVDNAGASTSVRIQKLMFLYCMNAGSSAPYEFFPHEMGAYSRTLSDDYHALVRNGYLEFDGNRYIVSRSVLNEDYAVPESISRTMASLGKAFSDKDDDTLIAFTYNRFPGYSVFSKIADRLDLSDAYYKKVSAIRNKMASQEKGLYTVGYEGRSIDKILNILIAKGVTRLVDVRKNAFSMRYEFNKGYLSSVLGSSGISYIHCPDVGIDSGKRNELLPDGRRRELFEWYSQNVLPANTGFVDDVASMVEEGSVAFLCYEKDDKDCHRSHLARFCCEQNKRIHFLGDI